MVKSKMFYPFLHKRYRLFYRKECQLIEKLQQLLFVEVGGDRPCLHEQFCKEIDVFYLFFLLSIRDTLYKIYMAPIANNSIYVLKDSYKFLLPLYFQIRAVFSSHNNNIKIGTR